MTKRNRAATLTATYYAVIFAVLGAHLPYWPVWLSDWGLTDAEIGALIGWTTLVRIVGATLIPALADRFAIRRWMILGTSLGSTGASAVLLMGVSDAEWLLIASLIGGLLMTPPIYLGEALGVRASEQFRFSYPAIRAAGSAGFLAANLAVGALIGQMGPDVVLWIAFFGFGVVAVLGLMHPGGGGEAGTGMGQASAADLKALLCAPVFLLFGLTAALGQGSHAVYYAFSVLDWQARGIAPATTGQLWAISVAVETVFMLLVGRAWVAYLGPGKALGLAAIASVLRWMLMAMEPGELALWALQALHALTFALGHLAAIAFVAAAIPHRLVATAQGIASGVLGGCLHAAALFAAGAIVVSGGVSAGYWMSAGMAALSALLAMVLSRVWNGGKLVPN